RRHVEHGVAEIDRDDPRSYVARAERDGNERGSGANVEDRVSDDAFFEEIVAKPRVDGGMVHGVVVACLLLGIHRLRLEHSWEVAWRGHRDGDGRDGDEINVAHLPALGQAKPRRGGLSGRLRTCRAVRLVRLATLEPRSSPS